MWIARGAFRTIHAASGSPSASSSHIHRMTSTMEPKRALEPGGRALNPSVRPSGPTAVRIAALLGWRDVTLSETQCLDPPSTSAAGSGDHLCGGTVETRSLTTRR